MKELEKAIEETGLVPIIQELHPTERILLDISLLPQEYKNLGDLETTLKAYEGRFNVKVIPIDTSRQNLEGGRTIIAQIIK